MASKRIYNLTPAVDTQGKGMITDKSGDSEAGFTPTTYHTVTTLPATPISSVLYNLTETDGFAPKGVYIYTNGWGCIEQVEQLTLSWSGDVDIILYTGVSYIVNITDDVTSLLVNMTSDGECRFVLNNPDNYVVTKPIHQSIYKTGEDGLDSIGHPSVRMIVQRDSIMLSVMYEYSTFTRILIESPHYVLIANGAGYLDTGITLPENAAVYLKGAFDVFGGAVGEMVLMGMKTTGSYTYLGNQEFGTAYSIWCTDSQDGYLGVGDRFYHEWEKHQGGLEYDGFIESQAGTFTDCLSLNIFLFANNNDGTAENFAEGRIAEFLVYNPLDITEEYMHLIPVPYGSVQFSSKAFFHKGRRTRRRRRRRQIRQIDR